MLCEGAGNIGDGTEGGGRGALFGGVAFATAVPAEAATHDVEKRARGLVAGVSGAQSLVR